MKKAVSDAHDPGGLLSFDGDNFMDDPHVSMDHSTPSFFSGPSAYVNPRSCEWKPGIGIVQCDDDDPIVDEPDFSDYGEEPQFLTRWRKSAICFDVPELDVEDYPDIDPFPMQSATADCVPHGDRFADVIESVVDCSDAVRDNLASFDFYLDPIDDVVQRSIGFWGDFTLGAEMYKHIIDARNFDENYLFNKQAPSNLGVLVNSVQQTSAQIHAAKDDIDYLNQHWLKLANSSGELQAWYRAHVETTGETTVKWFSEDKMLAEQLSDKTWANAKYWERVAFPIEADVYVFGSGSFCPITASKCRSILGLCYLQPITEERSLFTKTTMHAPGIVQLDVIRPRNKEGIFPFRRYFYADKFWLRNNFRDQGLKFVPSAKFDPPWERRDTRPGFGGESVGIRNITRSRFGHYVGIVMSIPSAAPCTFSIPAVSGLHAVQFALQSEFNTYVMKGVKTQDVAGVKRYPNRYLAKRKGDQIVHWHLQVEQFGRCLTIYSADKGWSFKSTKGGFKCSFSGYAISRDDWIVNPIAYCSTILSFKSDWVRMPTILYKHFLAFGGVRWIPWAMKPVKINDAYSSWAISAANPDNVYHLATGPTSQKCAPMFFTYTDYGCEIWNSSIVVPVLGTYNWRLWALDNDMFKYCWNVAERVTNEKRSD